MQRRRTEPCATWGGSLGPSQEILMSRASTGSRRILGPKKAATSTASPTAHWILWNRQARQIPSPPGRLSQELGMAKRWWAGPVWQIWRISSWSKRIFRSSPLGNKPMSWAASAIWFMCSRWGAVLLSDMCWAPWAVAEVSGDLTNVDPIVLTMRDIDPPPGQGTLKDSGAQWLFNGTIYCAYNDGTLGGAVQF
eukprot:Skav225575  [mRNA]  locus=scaffold437:54366:55287:- [translate_table: standard]